MTLPGVPRILEDEVLDEGNPVCGPAFQRDPGPLNPCAGSLDPPQYTLDVFSSRHGLPLRALLHWEKTANLPLMNTHTHTLGATVVKPLKMASVPSFIPFAPSLANSSRPVPEVGVRKPIL
jgi:hypothetical protein